MRFRRSMNNRDTVTRKVVDEEELLQRLIEYCDDYVTVGESYFTEEDRKFKKKEIEEE